MEDAGQGGWTFERLRSKRDSKANLSSVHIFKMTARPGRNALRAVAQGSAQAPWFMTLDIATLTGCPCSRSTIRRRV